MLNLLKIHCNQFHELVVKSKIKMIPTSVNKVSTGKRKLKDQSTSKNHSIAVIISFGIKMGGSIAKIAPTIKIASANRPAIFATSVNAVNMLVCWVLFIYIVR